MWMAIIGWAGGDGWTWGGRGGAYDWKRKEVGAEEEGEKWGVPLKLVGVCFFLA